MRYLTVREVIVLHARVVSLSGGALGIRDHEGLESAVAQPQMTFDADELYPTIHTKAAALGHALIQNHAFLDGNKRIGHAAMEVFLVLNGFEISASVDEQEQTILRIATGHMSRSELGDWLSQKTVSSPLS